MAGAAGILGVIDLGPNGASHRSPRKFAGMAIHQTGRAVPIGLGFSGKGQSAEDHLRGQAMVKVAGLIGFLRNMMAGSARHRGGEEISFEVRSVGTHPGVSVLALTPFEPHTRGRGRLIISAMAVGAGGTCLGQV